MPRFPTSVVSVGRQKLTRVESGGGGLESGSKSRRYSLPVSPKTPQKCALSARASLRDGQSARQKARQVDVESRQNGRQVDVDPRQSGRQVHVDSRQNGHLGEVFLHPDESMQRYSDSAVCNLVTSPAAYNVTECVRGAIVRRSPSGQNGSSFTNNAAANGKNVKPNVGRLFRSDPRTKSTPNLDEFLETGGRILQVASDQFEEHNGNYTLRKNKRSEPKQIPRQRSDSFVENVRPSFDHIMPNRRGYDDEVNLEVEVGHGDYEYCNDVNCQRCGVYESVGMNNVDDAAAIAKQSRLQQNRIDISKSQREQSCDKSFDNQPKYEVFREQINVPKSQNEGGRSIVRSQASVEIRANDLLDQIEAERRNMSAKQMYGWTLSAKSSMDSTNTDCFHENETVGRNELERAKLSLIALKSSGYRSGSIIPNEGIPGSLKSAGIFPGHKNPNVNVPGASKSMQGKPRLIQQTSSVSSTGSSGRRERLQSDSDLVLEQQQTVLQQPLNMISARSARNSASDDYVGRSARRHTTHDIMLRPPNKVRFVEANQQLEDETFTPRMTKSFDKYYESFDGGATHTVKSILSNNAGKKYMDDSKEIHV